jgi:hypothetical protein
MLKIATTSLLLLMGSEARAQGRPVSTTLTCSRAASLVASQGATVLGTGVYTYDRYVSSSSSCVLGEIAEPAWVRPLITHNALSVISAVKGFSVKVADGHQATTRHGSR